MSTSSSVTGKLSSSSSKFKLELGKEEVCPLINVSSSNSLLPYSARFGRLQFQGDNDNGNSMQIDTVTENTPHTRTPNRKHNSRLQNMALIAKSKVSQNKIDNL